MQGATKERPGSLAGSPGSKNYRRGNNPKSRANDQAYFAPEAERVILSRALQNGIGSLPNPRPAADWFTNSNAIIFSSIREMEECGEPVNIISLTQRLMKAGTIEDAGGAAFVTELLGVDCWDGVVQSACDALAEHYKRRRLHQVTDRIAQMLEEGDQERALGIMGDAVKDFERFDSINGKVGKPSFSDLAPFLSGSAEQEAPTIGRVGAERSLFYAGRLNEIHGEPSTGKTNILIAVCNSVLADGGSVLYIDPEDTPRGFASRALALGGIPADLQAAVFYLHNPTPDEIKTTQQWAAAYKPTLVVLDGLAESMAAVGANEDTAGEVLAFFRSTLRPFADSGAAVVVADHVTKSTEGRGRWARGSGAKLGRYDGVVYEISVGEPYTPTKAGFIRLKISKDRNGGAGAIGEMVCEMHFTPSGDRQTLVEFKQPQQAEQFRPTAIMEKIVAYLRANNEAGKRELRELGKHEWVDKALAILLSDGAIRSRREGQKIVYTLAERGQNQ